MTEHCKGIGNWLMCLRCEHICTPHCPIEGDDVVAELALRLRAAEQGRKTENAIIHI